MRRIKHADFIIPIFLTFPGIDSRVLKIPETGNDRLNTDDSVPDRTTTVKV